MSGLKQLQDSVGVKVIGGSGCNAKYGGSRAHDKTLKGGKGYPGYREVRRVKGGKGKRSTKKARKTKKSKKSGKRKTEKKSFFARLFRL